MSSHPEWKLTPLWRTQGSVHWSGRPRYDFDFFVPAMAADEAIQFVKSHFGKEAGVRFTRLEEVGELLLFAENQKNK